MNPDIIIVGIVGEPDIEDSGAAQIAEVTDAESEGTDNCFFVRLHSWNDNYTSQNGSPKHTTMDTRVGRKVRITVEIID